MKKAQRIVVHEKYGGRCAYCGKVIAHKDMQVDHVLPKCRGGSDDTDNLMPACRRCNHYKRSADLEGFRRLVAGLHKRIVEPYIHRVALDYGIMQINEWDRKFYFEKVGEEPSDE